MKLSLIAVSISAIAVSALSGCAAQEPSGEEPTQATADELSARGDAQCLLHNERAACLVNSTRAVRTVNVQYPNVGVCKLRLLSNGAQPGVELLLSQLEVTMPGVDGRPTSLPLQEVEGALEAKLAPTSNAYVASVTIGTRSGKSLDAVITKAMPGEAPGAAPPASLVVVGERCPRR